MLCHVFNIRKVYGGVEVHNDTDHENKKKIVNLNNFSKSWKIKNENYFQKIIKKTAASAQIY